MYLDESDKNDNSYDLIIGRYLLHDIGIDLLFSSGQMKWRNTTIPMRDPSQLSVSKIENFEAEIVSMHDPDTTKAARIQSMIDLE